VVGYRVHRVVQQVMRDRTDTEGREQWINSACDVVNGAYSFDPEQPEHWPACDALAPHARALRLQIGSGTAPASYGQVLNQASVYLQVRGSYRDARDFLELALELALRLFGPDHANVAASRFNLALVLHALDEHEESWRQTVMALKSDLRQFGPDHPKIAKHLSILASIRSLSGEHGEALRLIEVAPESANDAARRSTLAIVLGERGEHEEALRQIENVLESALGRFGPDHLHVAAYRHIHAYLLHQSGENRAALEQIDLALAVFTHKLPPSHPSIAFTAALREAIVAAMGD
jgi:tetratricopeptide (TPR) repeat protein